MERTITAQTADLSSPASATRVLYWLGGLVSIILILYSLMTIMVMVFIGGPPLTIKETYSMLAENKFYGLLRLDIMTVFVMPLYYLLFYSIYKALKNTGGEIIPIATILVFAGLTLFLATPSVFSYVYLSDKYAQAATEIQRSQFLAAGEAILASDMWHGTGALVGGILLQTGAFLVSIAMLKQKMFSRLTAYTGIITHGLDLAHILLGFFLPAVGVMMMAVAGVLYLLWFPLVGIDLFKLGNSAR
ncbi:MAG TPA: hypothetical protein VGK00_02160 [Anaerolineales bacterium]|jgi:hypothetical protein